MESTPMEGGGDVNWRWRVGAEGARFLARASVTVNAYVADRQFSGVGGVGVGGPTRVWCEA